MTRQRCNKEIERVIGISTSIVTFLPLPQARKDLPVNLSRKTGIAKAKEKQTVRKFSRMEFIQLFVFVSALLPRLIPISYYYPNSPVSLALIIFL